MAKRKGSQVAEEAVNQEVERAPSRPIWESNPNLVLYVVGAIVLALGGWWLYKNMIMAPKQKEAVAAMWHAQRQFERDSFRLALDNPGGGFDGFVALADKYSGTPAGNSAQYYAGICYLQLGEFDNAIKHLDDYSAEGSLMPAMKNGTLGDCYAEKGEYDKALNYYEKAASATENKLLAGYYLKKLGMLNEYQGNKDAALKAYERLHRDYPNPTSADWREVEKYIYRAGAAK
ncbi:MAG: tetratricopeptide repeat protein [Saprospiraceae bacterium]|nr:tetratricopeptide repeat protein [Saprospiraceae bacterium]MCB0543797.1 tetratricopeptide repeat protein [Saprospiraceae bacterium]MCB0576889.1 tetratricopeptide repeat protein [Saprospiraceae bacterium]MCB9307382.1 tetratricopeptide repeat protein [Lewinellaceae bacterium]MCB9355830.1 tetratricopeptide repeat protein [Lewinellaceae bacterium]